MSSTFVRDFLAQLCRAALLVAGCAAFRAGSRTGATRRGARRPRQLPKPRQEDPTGRIPARSARHLLTTRS
jgi:hypothetical protein